MPYAELDSNTITKKDAAVKSPVIASPIQKASMAVTETNTNRNLVKALQTSGFENIKINFKDSKGNDISQPPPDGFMDLAGLNKLKQFTITAELGGKTHTFEIMGSLATINDGKTSKTLDRGGRQDLIESQKMRNNFADACVEKRTMTREEANDFKKMNSTDAYDWLKNKGMLQDFLNFVEKELQRLSGSKGSGGDVDAATSYTQGNVLSDKMYSDLHDQVEIAKGKAPKDEA